MPWVLLTKSIAKSVDMATRIPRLFRTYALSSDASAELVPQTAQLSASHGILPGISLTRPTRILASCAKTSDAAAHNHHPEQAIHSASANLLLKLPNKVSLEIHSSLPNLPKIIFSVGSSDNDDTEDEDKCCKYNTCTAT